MLKVPAQTVYLSALRVL